MAAPAPQSPDAPLGVRLALIALLPLLALALYIDGQRYDSGLVEFSPRESAAGPDPALLPEDLAGLPRAGAVRTFTAENLYEYINGHAEYFLAAGFQGLAVGEYGAASDGQPRLVVNLYDLGEALNAFGVLVDEAGEQEAVDIGAMGFRSGQRVSFLQGRFYVQMSLFDDGLSAEALGAALAQGLAGQVGEQDLAFRFPDFGKVVRTGFVKEDYRGLGFLKRVLERVFERDGREIQSFLVQGTTAEIDALVGDFETFFREDEMPYRQIDGDGLRLYLVEDPYEGDWFFVPLGERLIGVYAPVEPWLTAEIAAFAGSGGVSAPTR